MEQTGSDETPSAEQTRCACGAPLTQKRFCCAAGYRRWQEAYPVRAEAQRQNNALAGLRRREVRPAFRSREMRAELRLLRFQIVQAFERRDIDGWAIAVTRAVRLLRERETST